MRAKTTGGRKSAKYLNADSLHYLSQGRHWVKATGSRKESSYALACYEREISVPYDPVLDKHLIERRRRQAQTLGEASPRQRANQFAPGLGTRADTNNLLFPEA